MKRLLLPALLLAHLLFMPGMARAGEPGEQSSESPVEYFTVGYGAWGLLQAHVLRFSPAEVDMKLLYVDDQWSHALVSLMPGCADADACFTGPFFSVETGKPIGLLVSDAKLLRPVKKISWGMFWIDSNGAARISRRKEFEKKVDIENDVRFAVQVGPTLVRDGRIPPGISKGKKRKLGRRTAIGIDSMGRVVVMLINPPIRLETMAALAVTKLDLVDMINLDGGSSAQLTVNRGRKRVNIPGVTIPVGIGLFSKQKQSVR